MFDADHITEYARKTIVTMMDGVLSIEYSLILSSPRLIDHLVQIDKIPREKIPTALKRLGDDSMKHMGQSSHIIKALGGEPHWGFEPLEFLADPIIVLQKQLNLEKSAMGIYRKAKKVAEDNPVKGLPRALRNFFPGTATGLSRTAIMAMLEGMAQEEEIHIQLVNSAIIQLEQLLPTKN
jgi:hypothetical protein